MTVKELLLKPHTQGHHLDCLFRAVDPDGKEHILCRHSFPPLVPKEVWERHPENESRLDWVIASEDVKYDFSVAPLRLIRGDGKTAELSFSEGKDELRLLGSFALLQDGKCVGGANAWHKDGENPHVTLEKAIGPLVYIFLAQP